MPYFLWHGGSENYEIFTLIPRDVPLNLRGPRVPSLFPQYCPSRSGPAATPGHEPALNPPSRLFWDTYWQPTISLTRAKDEESGGCFPQQPS